MELNYVVTIVNNTHREEYIEICKNLDLHMTLTTLGSGTATSEHLSLYGLSPTRKAIISTVAGADTTKKLFKAAKQKLFIDIPGNGIIMAIPVKSVGGGKTLAYLTDSKDVGGAAPEFKFEHELIIVILNEGYSDNVMDAARSAGAGGGTVLHAKGTGASRGEKFFGVSLASEKDLIYIVAKSDKKADIMKAIHKNAGTGTEAGAICFSLPISAAVGLRNSDDD